MNGGVTKVRCDGSSPVLRLNPFEVLGHFVKSFVPSDALPTMISATDGIFEPVFIIVNVLQGHRLRADVPAAERVILVTADLQTLAGVNGDFDATYRFAEIASAIVRGAIARGHHGGFGESLAS